MKYPFKIVVISIVVSLLGAAAIPLLPIDLKPTEKEPKLSLNYSLPNATPAIVESQVTSVLENMLSQLESLNTIYSISNYNEGSIELTFDKSADLDFKRFEVATILRQVYNQLPEALTYPTIRQGTRDSDGQPLIIYRLSGAMAGHQLKAFAEENIRKKLVYLRGVDQVNVRGAEDIRMTIRFDQQALSTYGLDLDAIKKQIGTRFGTNYLGLTPMSTQVNLSVSTGDTLTATRQLEKLIVKYDTTAVRLKDVASIYLEENTPSLYYRVNGLNSITIAIYAKDNVNKIALADAVYKQVSDLSKVLPSGYELIKDADQTDFLREELHKIYQRAGLSILILTLFIFLINRNWRYLVTLLSGVVITLLITSLLAYLLSIQVHLYTIAGITIAFGLIVDNAMVMVDHLHKKKNTRIFSALLGASLTTIVALMLVFFLPEEERKNLIEFAQVIALSLFVSLLVALFYTPAVVQLLSGHSNTIKKSMRQKRRYVAFMRRYYQAMTFITRRRSMFVVFVVLAFGLPIFMLPSTISEKPLYNKTIGSDLYQEHIRPVADKALGGALRLFVRDVFEKSSYRTPEKTRLYVNASLPFGSTLEQVNEVLLKVEEYLKTVDGISQFVTQVYSGRHGSIVIEFDPPFDLSSLPYQLKSRLIARSLDWGGVEWNVYGVGRGFSNSNSEGLPSFRVLLKGYNYETLETQARIMANKLLLHKRIQEVNINERLSWREESSSEYSISFKNDALALAGLNVAGIQDNLFRLSGSERASMRINFNDKNIPLFFVEQNAHAFSKFDISNRNIVTSDGMINLNPLSTFSIQKTANAIHKQNRQYIRVLGFEYFGSFKFGNEYLDQVMKAHESQMPLGYEAQKLTWEWNWEKTKRQYGLILLLLVGIYFICSILFENLKQPIYIIASVPISFIGLFLIFSLFDFYFDQGGYAAFVLLGGLVVNAAIFVINDLNNYHKGKYNRNVIKAIIGKSQPILLTIISTCFGLVPFLIEGQSEVFWFSLAIGTIGGLVFSLLAVFVCLPIFLFKSEKQLE